MMLIRKAASNMIALYSLYFIHTCVALFYHSKSFTNINSLSPPNNPIGQGLFLSLFYR